jgi:hypothetical protein
LRTDAWKNQSSVSLTAARSAAPSSSLRARTFRRRGQELLLALAVARVVVEERADHVALLRRDAREVGQDVVGRPRVGEVAVEQQSEADLRMRHEGRANQGHQVLDELVCLAERIPPRALPAARAQQGEFQ